MNDSEPDQKRGLWPSIPSMEVLIVLGIFVVCCFIPSIQETLRQRAEDANFSKWESKTTAELWKQHAARKIFKKPDASEFFAIKLF